jgi:predicted component of type VI protein secretion system
LNEYRAGFTAVSPGVSTAITLAEFHVQGIATLDELVETFAAVLENQGPPIDIGTAQPRSALAALAWNHGFRSEPPKTEKNLSDFLVWRLWYTSEQAAQQCDRRVMSAH